MKQTRKALKAEIINELAKKYKQKYEKRIEQLANSFSSLRTENRQLRIENDEMTEKILKYEDWIHRLLEFCDLTEDERKEAIVNLKVAQKENQQINEILQIFKPYLGITYFPKFK